MSMSKDEKQVMSEIPELNNSFDYTPEGLEDWRKATAEAMYAVNEKLYSTENGAVENSNVG